MLTTGSIAAIDHWLAFALLTLVGGRMVLEALRRQEDEAPPGRSPWVLVATAVGNQPRRDGGGRLAGLPAARYLGHRGRAIGFATFCMATGGILAGRLLGTRLGRIAEAIGGVALMPLGGGGAGGISRPRPAP